MKKFKPFLLVLATMFLLQNALFAVDYDLYVGGVQVTDANKDNITGSTILAGTVSYDPTSKTLTLNNATIETLNSTFSEKRGIYNNNIAGLTINLIGTNTITVPEDIFRFDKSTTISGSGSLHCIGGDDAISLDKNVHIRISNTTLSIEIGSNANGDATVFYCYTSDTVTITNSTFRVQGQNEFNDAALKFNLSDCAFVTPTGASYSDGALVDGNGNTVSTDPIVIMPNNMDFYVADVQVTPQNMSNIAGPSITGHVSFDPVTNTLTLDNATLTPVNNLDGIQNAEAIHGLTIELIGNNAIVCASDDGDGIETTGPTLITGDGSLDITANYGFNFYYGNLEILNTTIHCHIIWTYGVLFWGDMSNGNELSIINSIVTVDGNYSDFSIFVTDSWLSGCRVVEPAGGYLDEGILYDFDGNEVLAGTPVVIAPAYPLWVADVQVHALNLDSIAGPSITGLVTYDTATLTLTLNNATLTVGNEIYGDGIWNEGINDLTIELIGDNHIYAENDFMEFDYSTTITGHGTLDGTAGGQGFYLASDVLLFIENTNISVELNGGYAFYCHSSDTLFVTNSLLRFEGHTKFNDLSFGVVLQVCDFVEPTGAYYDGEDLYNSDYATLVGSSPITIAPVYPLWVADVQVHALNLDSIAGPSITGHVSFDTATTTLTLNNAALITEVEDDGINYEGFEDLTIELIGQNSILNEVDDGISTVNSLTIIGDGSLEITAPYGINFWGGNLSILNTQISFHVVNEPFYASNSFDEVNITNSTVSVDGQENFSYGVDTLILTACAIVEPVGASFYDMQIRDSLGEVVVAPILIAPLQPDPIDTTSIYDVAANLSVQLYPNPATTLLNVVAEGFDYVEILNFVGQRLYRAPLTDGTTQLNVATLPAGTYFLRLQGDSVAVKKFIKN